MLATASLFRAKQSDTVQLPFHGWSNTLRQSVSTAWDVALEPHTEDQVLIVTLWILVHGA